MAERPSSRFTRSLTHLYAVIPPRRRREAWLLALLTAAGAASEVVAIGSVVPFLALLADSAAGERYGWARNLFEAVGAQSRGEQLVVATAALCLGALAAALFKIMLVRKTQNFAFSIGHEISVEAQRRMLLQPYSWHLAHNSSEQLAAIGKVEVVASTVLLPLMQSIAATALIFVVVVALLQIAPIATLVAGVGLGAAYYALGLHARRRLQSNSLRLRSAFEQRIRIVQEGLGGIRDLILDGSHRNVIDEFRAVDFDLAQARADSGFIATVPRYLIEPAGILIMAAVALYLSREQGGLVAALPALGALAFGAQRLLPLVQQLYNGWSSVAANKSLVDDVVQQLRLPIPSTVGPAPRRLPFHDSIEFRRVSFIYAGAAQPSVRDLSFTVRRGSRVALLGPTGSGKSTTADLLMGLLEPSEGIIVVDGAELDSAKLPGWRSNIAHVPQILFLADASIAQNIAMGAQFDMGRVQEAIALAQLDEFVSQLPEGYHTRVGERAIRISGGQRQRLALARAIYKASPLLVLDEATSALDDDTEAAIAGALDVLQHQGRTIVIIAHRSKLIGTCTGLIKLANGRIVECSGDAAGKVDA
jgi:ABC-type multidrug transport system fused ATPase/permease subunit